ncbi:MAG: kelch motif-containing protein, partial [Actinomycetota bacterium]|nr:kelch motif-containing protein [Actinomycetota bacterium]
MSIAPARTPKTQTPVDTRATALPPAELSLPPRRTLSAEREAQPLDFTAPKNFGPAQQVDAPAPASPSAGSWTALANAAPGRVQLMLLLSDGTVMAAAANEGPPTYPVSKKWFKLTPDSHGSYVNGTWTTLQSMADTRLFYSSYVLQSGKVFVAGGEYGTGAAKAEIYDPLANTWSQVPIPSSLIDPTQPWPGNPTKYQQALSDANSAYLSNGKVLIAPVLYKTQGQTLLYDIATNAWSAGPDFISNTQDEATWLKLPDNSILTPDPAVTTSERYIPSSNTWLSDSNVPVSLYDGIGQEIGAAFLLPDGRGFFLGATGTTAAYTPSGTTAPGTWAATHNIPQVTQYPEDNNGNQVPGSAFSTQGATPDSAAAILPNGKILCAFSGALYNDGRIGKTIPNSNNYWKTATNPRYPSPTSFYEYDPATDTFTSVTGPTGTTDNIAAYQSMMLDLPDGTVLYAHQNTDLYVYNPGGTPVAAGKPTVTSFTRNSDGSYHLIGKNLNGISQGAGYGDDAQMDTNYPIIRLTSGSNIYYARTYNWSSNSVATGTATVTTEFTLPPGLPAGNYSLYVSANGISSDAIPFSTSSAPPVVTITTP